MDATAVARSTDAGATSEPLVRLEAVRKSFGDNLVLDGIDVSVASGLDWARGQARTE